MGITLHAFQKLSLPNLTEILHILLRVEIKLSTLKPRCANVMIKVYPHLKTENGKRKSDDKKRFSSCWDNGHNFSGSHWEHANA